MTTKRPGRGSPKDKLDRDLQAIVRVHDNIVRRYGGALGIIDIHILEAALSRPSAGLSDGTELFPDTVSKAAALMESLIKYHPFVDGNKRTAVIAASLFLSENGYVFNFGDKEIEKFTLEVAESRLSLEEIKEWIRKRMLRLPYVKSR
jgi:death-on-curing protein